MNLFWSPLSLPSPRKAGRGWPKAGRGVGSWEGWSNSAAAYTQLKLTRSELLNGPIEPLSGIFRFGIHDVQHTRCIGDRGKRRPMQQICRDFYGIGHSQFTAN